MTQTPDAEILEYYFATHPALPDELTRRFFIWLVRQTDGLKNSVVVVFGTKESEPGLGREVIHASARMQHAVVNKVGMSFSQLTEINNINMYLGNGTSRKGNCTVWLSRKFLPDPTYKGVNILVPDLNAINQVDLSRYDEPENYEEPEDPNKLLQYVASFEFPCHQL